MLCRKIQQASAYSAHCVGSEETASALLSVGSVVALTYMYILQTCTVILQPTGILAMHVHLCVVMAGHSTRTHTGHVHEVCV